MRKIKFRTWWKKYKEMNHDPDVIFHSVGINTQFESKDFIFMQFTGLKDRNGKEIYEGDIVKDRQGNVYPVIFERGAFRTNGYVPVEEFFKDEIIGNIYENPELLK